MAVPALSADNQGDEKEVDIKAKNTNAGSGGRSLKFNTEFKVNVPGSQGADIKGIEALSQLASTLGQQPATNDNVTAPVQPQAANDNATAPDENQPDVSDKTETPSKDTADDSTPAQENPTTPTDSQPTDGAPTGQQPSGSPETEDQPNNNESGDEQTGKQSTPGSKQESQPDSTPGPSSGKTPVSEQPSTPTAGEEGDDEEKKEGKSEEEKKEDEENKKKEEDKKKVGHVDDEKKRKEENKKKEEEEDKKKEGDDEDDAKLDAMSPEEQDAEWDKRLQDAKDREDQPQSADKQPGEQNPDYRPPTLPEGDQSNAQQQMSGDRNRKNIDGQRMEDDNQSGGNSTGDWKNKLTNKASETGGKLKDGIKNKARQGVDGLKNKAKNTVGGMTPNVLKNRALKKEKKEILKKLEKLNKTSSRVMGSNAMKVIGFFFPGIQGAVTDVLRKVNGTKNIFNETKLRAQVTILKAKIAMLKGLRNTLALFDGIVSWGEWVTGLSETIVIPILLIPCIPFFLIFYYVFGGPTSKAVEEIIDEFKKILKPLEEKYKKMKAAKGMLRRLKTLDQEIAHNRKLGNQFKTK